MFSCFMVCRMEISCLAVKYADVAFSIWKSDCPYYILADHTHYGKWTFTYKIVHRFKFKMQMNHNFKNIAIKKTRNFHFNKSADNSL